MSTCYVYVHPRFLINSQDAGRSRHSCGCHLWLISIHQCCFKFRGSSQVEHHVNVALATVSTGLAGRKNEFFLGPWLVPRQSGQVDALEAIRFACAWFQAPRFFCKKRSVLDHLSSDCDEGN